jgi:hypothetical protein
MAGPQACSSVGALPGRKLRHRVVKESCCWSQARAHLVHEYPMPWLPFPWRLFWGQGQLSTGRLQITFSIWGGGHRDSLPSIPRLFCGCPGQAAWRVSHGSQSWRPALPVSSPNPSPQDLPCPGFGELIRNPTTSHPPGREALPRPQLWPLHCCPSRPLTI